MTPEQVATLRVNPSTAFRLLTDFAALKPGDWVVQNGANSAVGRHVIQLAKHRGLRTVNFVRRPELIAELTASGADLVLLDDDTAKQHVRDALGDANVLLGLNCVGGESAARLSSILSPKATMVTYGAMSRKALTVSNAHLIFKEIQFKGFWVTRWIKEATPDARQQMFTELAELAKSGVIKTPIEQIYPLADVLTAVGRAAGSSRNGKILLKLS
jgi:trans-2-enoyl-CoA reductase